MALAVSRTSCRRCREQLPIIRIIIIMIIICIYIYIYESISLSIYIYIKELRPWNMTCYSEQGKTGILLARHQKCTSKGI